MLPRQCCGVIDGMLAFALDGGNSSKYGGRFGVADTISCEQLAAVQGSSTQNCCLLLFWAVDKEHTFSPTDELTD